MIVVQCQCLLPSQSSLQRPFSGPANHFETDQLALSLMNMEHGLNPVHRSHYSDIFNFGCLS